MREMNRAHEAAISKYKKIDILDWREVSDSWMIASVEDFRAYITLFMQFFITKKAVGLLSVIELSDKVDIRYALTTISIIASHIEKT